MARWPVDHVPVSVIAGAVARTIPALFAGVPRHNASEVLTDSQAFVEQTTLIPISGDLQRPASYEGAFTRLDFVTAANVCVPKPVRIVGQDDEILLSKIRKRVTSEPRWIVKFCPPVLSTQNQISQQHSRDCAVRHSIP